MKKILILTLVIFAFMSMGTAFAITSLQSISKIIVSPEKITREDDVTVTLTSTAPNIDHINLSFSTVNGNADFNVTLKPTSTNFQYSGSGKLPNYIILGTWQLNQLIIYYKNSQTNFDRYSYVPLKAAGKAITFGSTSAFYEANKDIITGTSDGDTITPPPAAEVKVEPKILPNSFTDIQGHWAKGSIQKLIDKNFIKGYPDGYFLPNKSITRAEFIKILISALGLKSTNGATAFSDTKTHWASNEIAAAKEAKITSGYNDGTFKPNSNITRAEIVSMLSMAKQFPQKTSTITFIDVKKGYWAEPAIYAAAANNIVSGYKGGLFKPTNDATRAEACSMIDSFLTLFKLYL